MATARPLTLTQSRALGSRAQFKVYLFIEGCIWLPTAYILCYRFQPTVRFVRTETGRKIVTRAGAFLAQYTPSWHASLSKLAGRIEGAPAGRAAAEWALLNKVLAPVSFPTKIAIAHQIVQRRGAVAESVPSPTAPAAVSKASESS